MSICSIDGNLCIKEGWLQKRGEHIKTWRPRYFMLYVNGYFLGFNTRPSSLGDTNRLVPNKKFFIKGCKIMTTDEHKQSVFKIRCFNSQNSIVQRVFAANSIEERNEWINLIQQVSLELNAYVEIRIKRNGYKIRTLHDFEFLKVLGKGTFGKVYLCREMSTRKIYAMKIVMKNLIRENKQIEHTMNENKAMKMIKHPFITRLIYSFQTYDRLCLIMTYANGGELFFHLSRERYFSEEKSKFYCGEIVLALGYLHSHDIMYRDIKLENILIDCDGHVKLADFGLCKMNMSRESKTYTFCGTPEYLAPEIILNVHTHGYGRAIDWYALGILLYEMLVGCLPYSNRDVKALLHSIVHTPLELPFFLSLNAKHLLQGLLEKDPEKRVSDASEIQSHAWFSNINWDDLFNRKIQAPFRPQVTNELDLRYFDKKFTNECIQITTTDDNLQYDTCVNHQQQHYFDSFSFYGSKISLNTLSSNLSNSSDDKYDAQSLLNTSFNSSKSSLIKSRAYSSCSDKKECSCESNKCVPMVIDGQAILNNLIKCDLSYKVMNNVKSSSKRLKIRHATHKS